MNYKDFYRTIRSSTYDPGFYVAAKSHQLAAPIKILILLGLFAIGTTAIVLYSGLISFAFSDLPERVESLYPNDLAITLAHGELSINQPQPYYIDNPLRTYFPGTTTPQYLAIFDTDDTLGTDLEAQSTFAMVRKTYAITRDNTANAGKIQKYPTDTATSTLTKSDITAFVARMRPYFTPGIIGGGLITVVLGTILGTFFWIVFHLLYVLLPALIIMVCMMLRKTPLTFGESYLTALYASIPIAIAVYLLMTLGIALPTFGYTALLLALALINLTQPTATS